MRRRTSFRLGALALGGIATGQFPAPTIAHGRKRPQLAITMQASSLNTRRRWLLTFLLSLVIWSVQSAEAFDIAIGGEKGPAYNLGVGISSLVKVKLLPTSKIDFDPVVTKDDQASLEALNNGSADFALVASDDQNLPTGAGVRALANLGGTEAHSKLLLVRSEVDDRTVHQVLETIFDEIDFLKAADPQIQVPHPDTAVMGLISPLHTGAKRFYAEWWSSAEKSESVEDADDEAQDDQLSVISRRIQGKEQADARNYVLYFDFDDAALDEAAQANLRQAARFAATMRAPSIIVAAYTDSVGDAEYNSALAERRAESVMQALDRLDVRYSDVDLKLYGERSPWAVTLDGIEEANNRRVELFIEESVPELQPLPQLEGLSDTRSDSRTSMSRPNQTAPKNRLIPFVQPDSGKLTLDPTM